MRAGIKDEQLILEQILFAGKYSLNGKPVELKENGQLTGLQDYTFYIPIIDYNDAAMQVNQIYLKKDSKSPEYFGFKFEEDTLNIYNLNCIEYRTFCLFL